ncbi:MAG: hypothetical protein AAB497_01805 [Patescibacteria group bacterium]
MPDDVKSKIAELEKELYSKDFQEHSLGDTLRQKEPTVAPVWDTAGDAASFLGVQAQITKRHYMMKKFVKISIIFFVLASAIAGFIWWKGSNIISGENIAIDISAPVTIEGGDPFETKFVITNGNKVSVEEATLFVEYPLGFYSVADKAELPRIAKDLGVIVPGQSIAESVNTILYGEENTSKEVMATLEYRMAGSNATIKKTATYMVKIASSLVNVKLEMLKEASAGQEVELVITVDSNNKNPIDNLIVEASYPLGFNFQSAEPLPAYGTNSWKISKLAPQEKRTIRIRGIIDGQENEEKVVKISIGAQSPKDERIIGLTYNTATESTIITKPFIGLDIAVDNDHAADHAAVLGRSVRVDVLWKSNSPTQMADLVIEAKLKGDALNRYSIYAQDGGFYRSIDDTIVWDKTRSLEFASLEPGARGTVGFSFSPVALGIDAGRLIKNPKITVEVRARARRLSEMKTFEDIASFAMRNVKFETDLRLSARGLYFTGAFENTGPLPPQAEKETTYTVEWTVRSSSNSVSNTSVKTTLPIYVKWLGAVSPEGEGISYNENTSEVVWNAGRIPIGGTREGAFQISFLPSLSQIGQIPRLTGDIFLVGTDDFTKTEVRDRKSPITTYLLSDPQFVQGQANVVK